MTCVALWRGVVSLLPLHLSTLHTAAPTPPPYTTAIHLHPHTAAPHMHPHCCPTLLPHTSFIDGEGGFMAGVGMG